MPAQRTFHVHTLPALKDNFIFLLRSSGHRCAAVDPGEAGPVLNFLAKNSLTLTHILCTHHHQDHVGGIPELVKATGAAVCASNLNASRIPECNLILSEQTRFSLWDELEARILEVPGHTRGALAFYLPAHGILFVGDTLFSAGCGRLFEGTYDEMFSSLAKIKSLSPETKIYFAHEYTLRNLEFVIANMGKSELLSEYKLRCRELLAKGRPTVPSTLELELGINPFLRARSVEEFKRWRDLRDLW